jgi:hypothetical protein
MTLPENWRFRSNWFGQLVLQRRFRVPGHLPGCFAFEWMDAEVEDLKVLFKEQA